VTSTIMFPSATGGDPVKRRLSGDETRFVCSVYPGEVLNHVLTCGSNNSLEEESEEIPSEEAGGCSLSGGAAPGGLPLLGSLAAMAILVARRRRGSR
jgi:hypothetical protein